MLNLRFLSKTRRASVREIYELKRTANPPINLDQASALLTSILRGRARCEEIDEVNTAAPTAGLGLAADNSDILKALLAAIGKPGVVGSSLDAKSLSALVSTLQAVADPTKTNAGDKDKKPPHDIPRGPDGKPTTWIKGMALCRCGIGGGKHLFKDCPKAKEKASKKAKNKPLGSRRECCVRTPPRRSCMGRTSFVSDSCPGGARAHRRCA